LCLIREEIRNNYAAVPEAEAEDTDSVMEVDQGVFKLCLLSGDFLFLQGADAFFQPANSYVLTAAAQEQQPPPLPDSEIQMAVQWEHLLGSSDDRQLSTAGPGVVSQPRLQLELSFRNWWVKYHLRHEARTGVNVEVIPPQSRNRYRRVDVYMAAAGNGQGGDVYEVKIARLYMHAVGQVLGYTTMFDSSMQLRRHIILFTVGDMVNDCDVVDAKNILTHLHDHGIDIKLQLWSVKQDRMAPVLIEDWAPGS